MPPAAAPEAAIFLDPLPPPIVPEETARKTAESFFKLVLPELSGPGVTTAGLGAQFTVARQEARRDGNFGEITEETTWVRVDRSISGRRIYGPGSAAVAEVKRGRVIATVLRWDRAENQIASVFVQPLNDTILRSRVESEFSDPDEKIIEVLSTPELVYYDDRHTLTPVYRVVVSVNHRDGAPADRMAILFPADGSAKPVPPSAGALPDECKQPLEVNPAGIRVDRYVLKGDDNLWLANALAFNSKLSMNPGTLALRRFCYLKARMLAAKKAEFIDSSHIALIESHGLPGEVAVGGAAGWVSLDGVGGFGSQTDSLRLLILHSCQVIQTGDDNRKGWAARWFKVFDGLHTVLGYRTTMEINDGVSAAFATHLGNDKPLIRSWFAEVVAAYDTASAANKSGRAAAITSCGEGNAKRSDLKRMLAPPCLVSFWLRD
ncbi:MAG TPA: DUF6345 domain-containing protein [Thermoanaerobaculia bacterium]